MMVPKSALIAAMALFAGGAYGQSIEVPAIPGDKPRTPVVWATMDAFDLERSKLKTGQPLVTFDAQFLERNERQQQAQMERLRTRLAERLRETEQAGAGQREGDAAVGPGRRGRPAAGSQ